MIIEIAGYELENDVDCKCIPDGWEISTEAVNRLGINVTDFKSAYWIQGDGIIVEIE